MQCPKIGSVALALVLMKVYTCLFGCQLPTVSSVVAETAHSLLPLNQLFVFSAGTSKCKYRTKQIKEQNKKEKRRRRQTDRENSNSKLFLQERDREGGGRKRERGKGRERE